MNSLVQNILCVDMRGFHKPNWAFLQMFKKERSKITDITQAEELYL